MNNNQSIKDDLKELNVILSHKRKNKSTKYVIKITHNNKNFSDELPDSNIKLVKKHNIKEQFNIITKILDMYPILQKNKDLILDNVFEKKEINRNTTVFDKIVLDNDFYYLDNDGCILNSDIELEGVYKKHEDGVIYVLFKNDILSKFFTYHAKQIEDGKY